MQPPLIQDNSCLYCSFNRMPRISTTKMDTAKMTVSRIRPRCAEVHAAAEEEQQLECCCIAVKPAAITMYLLNKLYTLYLTDGHLSICHIARNAHENHCFFVYVAQLMTRQFRNASCQHLGDHRHAGLRTKPALFDGHDKSQWIFLIR